MTTFPEFAKKSLEAILKGQRQSLKSGSPHKLFRKYGSAKTGRRGKLPHRKRTEGLSVILRITTMLSLQVDRQRAYLPVLP
jgi:hypothetical protein